MLRCIMLTCFRYDSMQDLCKHGGWQLGHLMDGVHAEYFRVPYADSGLYHVPPGVDERGLLVVSDTLPTGLEVGAMRGNVRPGCTVAIVGAGALFSPHPFTTKSEHRSDELTSPTSRPRWSRHRPRINPLFSSQHNVPRSLRHSPLTCKTHGPGPEHSHDQHQFNR